MTVVKKFNGILKYTKSLNHEKVVEVKWQIADWQVHSKKPTTEQIWGSWNNSYVKFDKKFQSHNHENEVKVRWHLAYWQEITKI